MRHPPRPRSPDLIPLSRIVGRLSMLTLACSRCERRGRLSVARLLAEWGEHAVLADISDELVGDCPRRGSRNVYEQCDVHWPDLPELFIR